MKKLLLIVTACVTFAPLFSQQGDGGIPPGFKFGPDYRDIDAYVHPAPDVAALRSEDIENDKSGTGPWRFGYNHYTSYTFQNSGTWTDLPGGGKIWQLMLTCENALTINLTFKNLHIPEGCELYIYDKSKKFVLGKFTDYHTYEGQLGAELVPGTTAIVEYAVPESRRNDFGTLEISTVTHGYRTADEYTQKAFGTAGSCNMNVNCPDGAPWADQKRGAVMLVTGSSGFCSGSLINNTQNDGKPYILTANHCSQGAVFANWIFRFQWESPTCTNPSSSPSFRSLSGSVLRARRQPSDFCLVEITGGLVGGTVPATHTPFFSGWNNSNTPPTSTVCIHHPDGDITKISFDDNPAVAATNTGLGSETNGTWQVQWDRNTTTEGGSSGSPLFDQNGRIIGQLWGGGASCANQTSPDFYGRVYNSWAPTGSNSTNQLKYWLDPNGTGVTFIDGYDPNAVSYALDAQLSGVASPVAGTTCNTSFSPAVTIRNNGTTTLTAVAVRYRVDNGTVQNYNWTGSLAQGATANVNLANFTVAAGNHSFKVYTAAPNGGTDQNAANDTSVVAFTVIGPATNTLPLAEGFEGTTFPPTGWTLENPGGGQTWTRTTAAASQGNASARKNNLDDSNVGDLDNLITPYLNFSGVTGATLTFKVAYARYNANYYDSLIVLASGDCGQTWNRVYNKGNTTLATAPNVTSAFVPTAAQWRLETVDLSAYAGSSNVRVSFQNKNGYGQYLYIDDINITGITGNNPPVPGFSASSSTPCVGETVTLTNSSTGATSYAWSIPGGTPSTSTAVNPTVTFAAAGTYTVTLTATNVNGSQNTQQTITVSAAPATPTVSSNTPVVAGSSINLTTAAVTGAAYYWTGPNGFTAGVQNPTVVSATAAASGQYCLYLVVNSCTSQTACTNVTVSAGTSVAENEAFSVTVFPNPATDRVYIVTGNNGNGLKTKVTDMTGKTIQNEMIFTDLQFSLDISAYAKGVYFLVMENEKGTVIRKIIKQ